MKSVLPSLGLATLLACFQTPALAAEAQADVQTDLLQRQIDTAALSRAEAALQVAEATWHRQHLQNYRYTLQRGCFCPPSENPPIQVIVRDGRVVSPASDLHPRDMAALFTLIREAIRNQASAVTVGYDPEYGYPTRIVIDPDSRMADEEIEFTLSGFQPR